MHIVQTFPLLTPKHNQKEEKMFSLETLQATPVEPNSSPRISFSAEFLDERNFISITPKSLAETDGNPRGAEFEFLLGNLPASESMITADELFFEGKLIPFWQTQSAQKLRKISLTEKEDDIIDMEVVAEVVNKKESRVNWFVDDDPSPRPPKCTVLWKELLRLRKQRPSSSSSSSSSSSNSFSDLPPIVEGKKEGSANREKHVKRIKKGLDRTRSTSIRIRPMVNVPICTQGKSNSLPPLFSLEKGKVL